MHFARFREPIYRYVRCGCRNAGEAEEFTQDIFLRLYRELESGKQVEHVSKWLYVVARNVLIDRSRRRGAQTVQPVVAEVWEQLAETVPDAAPTSEQLLFDGRQAAQLEDALACLTPLQRQCFHLRAEGWRFREIAELLEVSTPAAADAVYRAVERLRRKLEE